MSENRPSFLRVAATIITEAGLAAGSVGCASVNNQSEVDKQLNPNKPNVTETLDAPPTQTPFPTEIPVTPTPETTPTQKPTNPSTEEVAAREPVERPMNHEGVTGILREARYYSFEESQDLVYHAPLFDGVDLYSYFRPEIPPAPPGYKLLFLNFTTNTPDMDTYSHNTDWVTVVDESDAGFKKYPSSVFYSEAKNPRGFIGFSIPVPQGVVVNKIIARDADGQLTEIFNASSDLTPQ